MSPVARLMLSTLVVTAITGCRSNEQATSSTTPTESSPASQELRLIGKTFTKADQPVALVERDPEDAFLFVVERTGTVQIVDRAGRAVSTALDISKLTTTDSERGLLGLAFARDTADNWWAFVNHTNRDGNTVISGYAVHSDGRFDSSSRRLLLQIRQPYSNHNGGGMIAGPDGMLYISTGDGGSGGDPERNAQNLDSLLGKILRINPWPSHGNPYTIPSDNPFVATPNARPEIWSYGLRNPWRFSFDGNSMWIADVGQDTWEEIDHVTASGESLAGRGSNFGWSAYEGLVRFNNDETANNHTPPVHVYKHDGGRCSVIGGAVVHDQIPELNGWYVYSDFCSGKLYGLLQSDAGTYTATELSKSLGKIVAVNTTSDGVFAIDIDGEILKLQVAAG